MSLSAATLNMLLCPRCHGPQLKICLLSLHDFLSLTNADKESCLIINQQY